MRSKNDVANIMAEFKHFLFDPINGPKILPIGTMVPLKFTSTPLANSIVTQDWDYGYNYGFNYNDDINTCIRQKR